jgi:hypothetical protein
MNNLTMDDRATASGTGGDQKASVSSFSLYLSAIITSSSSH